MFGQEEEVVANTEAAAWRAARRRIAQMARDGGAIVRESAEEWTVPFGLS